MLSGFLGGNDVTESGNGAQDEGVPTGGGGAGIFIPQRQGQERQDKQGQARIGVPQEAGFFTGSF